VKNRRSAAEQTANTARDQGIQDGELVSHRRGCDPLISKDHGRTWNLDRCFEPDRFDFLRKDAYWVDGMSGRVASVVLDYGHALSAHGQLPARRGSPDQMEAGR